MGSPRERFRTLLPALLAVVIIAAPVAYLGVVLPSARAAGASQGLAPTFSLTDIYGKNFTLSDFRNNSVVVIEFTSLSCSECQIVDKSLAALYSNYNRTGQTHVQIISVFIEPQFGDTNPALRAFQQKNNVTWYIAQDTPSLAVSSAYGVEDIPDIVIINEKGQPVYNDAGAQSTAQLQSSINAALSGTASTISIVTVSVFLLAAVAGVSTFFSPCAFPMFPGYMGLFLGINANAPESSNSSGGTYKGAARRALVAGSVTAMGMIIVFLIIGLALIFASSLISPYIPDLLVVVGSVLIGLGALLLTNLQYWRIVAPLQGLWARLTGAGSPGGASAAAPVVGGKGFHLRLFSYGMGYAAAAAGCVAPVIFSAIFAGLALGLVGGIVNILIYSLTAAALMIVVTVALALAGKKYVNVLKAYTPWIKKISAGVLIVVGIYLIAFYYTAWGF